MPFNFSWFCDLLEDLARNRKRLLHTTTAARGQDPDDRIIISWFNKYDSKIKRAGPPAIALLSAFFPERRVDRVYNLQEKRLSAIFGRALGLGFRRARELNEWRQRDGADFSVCCERVMAQCEFDVPTPGREVTLEEVDDMLHQLAANSPFSSPSVRANYNGKNADEVLTPVLRRLQSREAKWLIRMILKSYMEVCLPERLVLSCFHFMMTRLLFVQNSFEAAVEVLGQAAIATVPPRPSKEYEKALLLLIAREVSPQVGIMIQRQPYYKARSIKHCCKMADKRRMSVERKYDGEYCQIHIDLSRKQDFIQIFSKSGKDSTTDRIGIHGAIKDGLRVGQSDCPIQNRCILEGELLVWSSYRKCFLPFHKIRKYVRHGGRNLGTAADSPRRSDEHLMVVLYDILLLDGKPLLHEPLTVRRHHLESMIHCSEGRCILGERVLIDFAAMGASTRLRENFAQAIADRWEGFVLKACEDAYFSWQSVSHGIKLKKDYITGLGDSADLCLVGGRRNATVELELGLGPLRWTSFHVGCIVNKDDVQRFDAKPKFKVIDELMHHSMSNVELLDLNKLAQYNEIPYVPGDSPADLDFIRKGLHKPTEVFKEPFVIEIMGAGYERPSDCDFYTLRFPRTVDRKFKLHSDRKITDTTSFKELQDLAIESLNPAVDPGFREDEVWVHKLLRTEGKSQSTAATSESPTPQNVSNTTQTSCSPSTERSSSTRPRIVIHVDAEASTEQDIDQNNDINTNKQNIPSGTSLDTNSTSSSYPRQRSKRPNEGLCELQQPRLNKRPSLGHRSPPQTECNGAEREILTSSGSKSSDIASLDVEEVEDGSLASFVDESLQTTESQSSDEPRLCTAVSLPLAPIIAVSPSYPDTASIHTVPRAPKTAVSTAIDSPPICTVKSAVPMPLPTPPSSDETQPPIVTKEEMTTSRVPGIMGPEFVHQVDAVQQSSLVVPQSPEISAKSKLSKSIYIPQSVYGIPNRSVRNQIYQNVLAMGMSYTTYAGSFLDDMDRTALEQERSEQTTATKTYFIVLLDFNNLQGGKKDLYHLFHSATFRAYGKSFWRRKLHPSSTDPFHDIDDPCLYLEDNIMVWDYSMPQHLMMTTKSALLKPKDYTSPTASQAQIESIPKLNLAALASLQHDSIGSELYCGWMTVHRRTWTEKNELKLWLVKNWDWTVEV